MSALWALLLGWFATTAVDNPGQTPMHASQHVDNPGQTYP
jgi:hypothetical protein